MQEINIVEGLGQQKKQAYRNEDEWKSFTLKKKSRSAKNKESG